MFKVRDENADYMARLLDDFIATNIGPRPDLYPWMCRFQYAHDLYTGRTDPNFGEEARMFVMKEQASART